MTEKPHVLVVDDDPDKRTLLQVALQMAGYDVRLAEDGAQAWAAIEANPPDLIVTDVMMPVMDGYELARRVRAKEEAAFTDHLTGLANRRRFERQLEREVARTRRYGRPFCLLMLDIDYFKEVNDTHGHEAGDEVLRHLAKVLQEGTRGIDLAARVGGEEFAVLLTETERQSGIEVTERLRAAVELMQVPDLPKITASFGLAEFPSSANTAPELLAAADAAMYEAKSQGRNRVRQAAELPNSAPLVDVQKMRREAGRAD